MIVKMGNLQHSNHHEREHSTIDPSEKKFMLFYLGLECVRSGVFSSHACYLRG